MDSRRGPNHSPFMHIYHKLLHIGLHGSHGSAGEGLREEGPEVPRVLQDCDSVMLWASPQQIRNCSQPHVPLPLLDFEAHEPAQPGNPRILEKKDLEE